MKKLTEMFSKRTASSAMKFYLVKMKHTHTHTHIYIYIYIYIYILIFGRFICHEPTNQLIFGLNSILNFVIYLMPKLSL